MGALSSAVPHATRSVIDALGVVAAAWAALYAGAASVAIAGVKRFSRARGGAAEAAFDLDDVVLIRPCAGAEPNLAARLSAAAGATHVVFAIASADDGASPHVDAAATALQARGVDVQKIVLSAPVGPNRKAEQMSAAVTAAAATQGTLVFVDSDVDLSSVDLRALVAPLASPDVGASWAPPIEAGLRLTAGDARSHAVLATSLHAFPLLATLDPHGMVGKLVAMKRTSLARAGGLDELRLYMGEDMELARRLRAAGLRVAAAPLVAPSMAMGRSVENVTARYLRWLQVVRAQRPWLLVSYPLLLAAGPSFALLMLASAVLRSPIALTSAAAGLLVRLALAYAARRATRSQAPAVTLPFDAFLGDLVLLSALATALTTRRVTWRGAVLTLGRDGRLRS